MGLAHFRIDRDREIAVARHLQRTWADIDRVTPPRRLEYTVGILLCGPGGMVNLVDLSRAFMDDEVVGRALSILACCRDRQAPGTGAWTGDSA